MPAISYYRSLKQSLSECSNKVTELEGNLQEKEKTIVELKEQNLRFSADLENFQKRVGEDSLKLANYASERIIKNLLPVLDSLENAGDAGTVAIRKQLESILQKEGLNAIEESTEFDPNRQEAIGMEEGGEPNTVKKVVRKGYVLGDRIIRHELVILNKGE